MANEHIGRLEIIGLGKESSAGTPVSADAWVPKMEGSFQPMTEKAKDVSAYGNITELRDSQTVKQMTEITLKGVMRDIYGGHFLMAAFGQDTITLKVTLASVVGSFTVGETVTGGTSGATGVVKRKEGTTTMYITIASGTFTVGAGETITGGTSGATATATYATGVRNHFFQLLNTNNHPAYTLYGVDSVGTYRSSYCLLDSLEFELATGNFLTFSAKYVGKKEESTSASPAFSTEENHFLAVHANLYLATALSGLSAASATKVTSMKMTIQKNVEEYMAFGSVDVDSLHNKQFKVFGEITALFQSTTLKDLELNSSKRAMRLKLINSDASIGSANATSPEIVIEMAQVSFEKWTKQGGNDDLVMQTLGFEAEFSVDDSESIIAFLQNTKTTTY
mgnify:FL=1